MISSDEGGSEEPDLNERYINKIYDKAKILFMKKNGRDKAKQYVEH